MHRALYTLCITYLLILPNSYGHSEFTLEDIQGGWWSNCEDPAVEFFISENQYHGDFYDSHPLTLNKNLLVFENGFVEGHSVNVSFKPREYKILSLSEESMVLESNTENGGESKWELFSCPQN